MYIVSITTSVTLLILSYDYEIVDVNSALMIDIVLYITPQIICWVLWRKTPQIADLVFIRQEMAYINLGVQVSLGLYLLCIIIFGIIFQSIYWPIAVGSWIGGIAHCMSLCFLF